MDNLSGSNLEVVVDRILFSARDLKKKLEAAKERRTADDNNQQLLEANLRDKRQIRQLERENTELKNALEDHQYGLEFIMTKYRSQIIKLIELNKQEHGSDSSETPQLKRNNSLE